MYLKLFLFTILPFRFCIREMKHSATNVDWVNCQTKTSRCARRCQKSTCNQHNQWHWAP